MAKTPIQELRIRGLRGHDAVWSVVSQYNREIKMLERPVRDLNRRLRKLERRG